MPISTKQNCTLKKGENMYSLNSTRNKKKLMLSALESSLGIVSTSCQRAGIGRSTHYLWLKTDKKYKEKVENIDEIAKDFAETSLFEQIRRLNTTATIFYLKTKAKDRGYVEVKYIYRYVDVPIPSQFDNYTTEELEDYVYQLLKEKRELKSLNERL